MMRKIRAWLIVLIGVILLLPLIGITQLGTVTDGILAWILGLAVLAIGILRVVTIYKS